MRGQAALVEAVKIVVTLRVPAQGSFLRKARLAQAFGTLRNVLCMLAKPFDGEARIDAKGFRHVRFCLVHFAQKRIRGREVCVVPVGVIARVERLFIFDDRGFGTTLANFYVAELGMKDLHERIARAQPYRLRRVGFRLVEMAERYFRARSCNVESRIVRIDGEAGVNSADGLVITARQRQVTGFGRER